MNDEENNQNVDNIVSALEIAILSSKDSLGNLRYFLGFKECEDDAHVALEHIKAQLGLAQKHIHTLYELQGITEGEVE